MQKWEYKVVGSTRAQLGEIEVLVNGEYADVTNDDYIQTLGASGWELVAVDDGFCFFKRPTESPNIPDIPVEQVKHELGAYAREHGTGTKVHYDDPVGDGERFEIVSPIDFSDAFKKQQRQYEREHRIARGEEYYD